MQDFPAATSEDELRSVIDGLRHLVDEKLNPDGSMLPHVMAQTQEGEVFVYEITAKPSDVRTSLENLRKEFLENGTVAYSVAAPATGLVEKGRAIAGIVLVGATHNAKRAYMLPLRKMESGRICAGEHVAFPQTPLDTMLDLLDHRPERRRMN